MTDFKDAYNAGVKAVRDYQKKMKTKEKKKVSRGSNDGDDVRLGCSSLKGLMEAHGEDFDSHLVTEVQHAGRLWDSKAVMLDNESIRTAVSTLAESADVERQISWMKKEVQKSKAKALSCVVAKRSLDKEIQDVKEKQLPEAFQSTLTFVGSEKEWSKALFEFELGVYIKDYFSVVMVSYGMPDIMIALKGECLVLIVPAEEVPTTTIASKAAYLENIVPGALATLREKASVSMLLLKQNQVVVIPANSLVMNAEDFRIRKMGNYAGGRQLRACQAQDHPPESFRCSLWDDGRFPAARQ